MVGTPANSHLRLFQPSRDQQHEPSNCDLCGGTDRELISSRDRRGQPLETAICTSCGLVAHRSIPTEEGLNSFYSAQYRPQYHGELSPSARRVMRAWKNGERIYRQLAPYLCGNERLFEIGAGIGCTVKVFELNGFDAAGIDPGRAFVHFAREELRVDVAEANLYDRHDKSTYDLTLLVHVIEHFSSPTRALSAIHAMMADEGRLYVECPNLAAPFAPRRRLFHFAHIHNFTPWTLTSMAEKCDFEVERWFSDQDDPNLQVLLRRIEASKLEIPSDGYARTLSRLERFNAFSYHARPKYLASRTQKIASYLFEHLTARAFVHQVVARCQSSRSEPRVPRIAAAAKPKQAARKAA